MARNTNKKTKKKIVDNRPHKKKTSLLIVEGVDYVDYKDVGLLRRFMSERAKIRARRVTGNDRHQQAEVARAIKVAREMALLPYSVRQVTQRKGGRRGDRRRDRPDREATLSVSDTSAPITESPDAGRPDADRPEAAPDTSATVESNEVEVLAPVENGAVETTETSTSDEVESTPTIGDTAVPAEVEAGDEQ